MDNIAEGFGIGGKIEFINFLTLPMVRHANASLNCTGLLKENISTNKNLKTFMLLPTRQKTK